MLAPGTRLGPYEITAKLGEGGMGEVYRATDSKLKREVAIKVLPAAFVADPERLARFEREAQLLAQLQHPNIASIYGLDETDGIRALVMELVEGPTLGERLARGALPMDEAIAVARQVAAALEAAHEKAIVHRDLKPQNIKLSPTGEVKVLDFGLAKALEPAGDPSATPSNSPTLMASPTLTAAGTQLGVILGTAAYMAPEQARGGAVDKRADVFAFGCVVYEMLTGKRAFAGETVSDILAAVLRAEVDWSALPAATAPALRRLLERCLEKDRRRRLRDLGDAALELEASAQPVQATPAARRAATPWAWLAVALAGGFLLAVGVERLLPRRVAAGRGAVRMLLGAPAGSTFHDAPAVSPDGRKVAFLARDGAGRISLHEGNLAGEISQLALPIKEVDASGNHPAWSPDSSALAVCDGQKLRVIELAGGAARTLADCTPTARGAAWGAAGILHAPGSNSPLYLVDPVAGGARAVSPFDGQVPDLSHRFPYFLPDGQRYLYLSWSNAAGAAEDQLGIFLGDLRSGTARKIADARSNAVLVSAGTRAHLLFQRDGKVIAAGFDPARGEFSAGESVVEDGVEWFANGGYAFFSGNARGDLVSLPPQVHQMSVLNVVDRVGAGQRGLDLPAIYTSLVASPDGKRLAATITDLEHGLDDVWVIDVERRISTRLTRGPDTHGDVVWRPDGKAIAYAQETTGKLQPYVVPADGSLPEARLITTPHTDVPAAFTADGEWLIVRRNASARRWELWAHSLRDGHEVALCIFPAASCWDAALSPDGHALAYVSDFSGRAEVYLRPFLAEGPQIQISSAGGRQPRWQADSTEVVFREPDGWVAAAEVVTEPPLRVAPAQRLFLISGSTVVAPVADHSKFVVSGRSAPGAALAHAILDWSVDR